MGFYFHNWAINTFFYPVAYPCSIQCLSLCLLIPLPVLFWAKQQHNNINHSLFVARMRKPSLKLQEHLFFPLKHTNIRRHAQQQTQVWEQPWAVSTEAWILWHVIFIYIDKQGGIDLRHHVDQMGEGGKDAERCWKEQTCHDDDMKRYVAVVTVLSPINFSRITS